MGFKDNDKSTGGRLSIDEETPPSNGGGAKFTTSSNAELTWRWLCSQYEFKRNVIKSQAQYRPIGSKGEFSMIDDIVLNTLSINASFSGLKGCTPSTIAMFLYSEHTEAINPITEYILQAAKRKPAGVIKRLCGYVKTNNDQLFFKYFRKWLASSVANAIIPKGCQNHTCLTLVGGQGAGKTTFLEWLCPPLLKDYLFTGELNLDKTDTVWRLAEYWFVNIEEQIKALNKQDANSMKQLITLPSIKGRRPYGRMDAVGHRLANFMASTNDDDFLTDPTGSRRYLCFRVDSIDRAYQTVKLDEVWAEAYHYYNENATSYFVTDADFKELSENNQPFVKTSEEQEYVNAFFSHPGENDYYLMPAVAIRDFLRNKTANMQLRERLVGIALKNYGYQQIAYRFSGTQFPSKAWKVGLNAGVSREPYLEKYHAHPNNNFKP